VTVAAVTVAAVLLAYAGGLGVLGGLRCWAGPGGRPEQVARLVELHADDAATRARDPAA
jgi:hypothetical protein